jgi:diguanylate cyclase (GGDEF)-like protein
MNLHPLRSDESAAVRRSAVARDWSEAVRLLPLVLPVALAGIAVFAAAVVRLAESDPSIRVLGGLLILLASATLAEAFPVPIESLPAGNVSLAAVFVVGTGVIYGWAPAALIACFTRVSIEIIQRRPLTRLVFNGSVYLLGGAAAGAVVELVPNVEEVGWLLLAVLAGAAAFYTLNVLFIASAIARLAKEPFFPLLRKTTYWTAVPFAIMASVSLMLQVLWQRSPLLAGALTGPLVAIVLYQRSAHRALAAMRLALTDPLTGLGNHRHFHERLQQDLDRAQADGRPLTLCLLDVDDFKRINDRYGHPVGDDVLIGVASHLRQGGEAFRLGGDEFALILPGRNKREGLAVAQAVMERLATLECAPGAAVSASAGIATYPHHGLQRNELMRVADTALYEAKRAGKNQVRAYRPGLRVAAVSSGA